MVAVSIIGLGPWGVCALERLVDACRGSPSQQVTIHVVEPGRPGGGMYSEVGPDYLVLNTPCGQHSLYPFPELLELEKRGRGFYEWVLAEGYRWDGTECRVLGPHSGGAAISPHDFLPRRLMGQYLEWFYTVLVREAPANVQIFHHRARAVDIEPLAGTGERICLDHGGTLTVDHVIITTGLLEPPAGTGSGMVSPYPIEQYVTNSSPEERVAVEGMGLVALDVVTALTVGLGGHYSTQPDGGLRYWPSGREPSLYLYSRGGYPYCAKSFASTDPMGSYEPVICTPEAVAQLQQSGNGGSKRQIEAREELLPLVFAEMELCYYTSAAWRSGGAEEAEPVRARLLDAWAKGTFDCERGLVAQLYGDFVAADYFFVGHGRQYLDEEDYEAQVYEMISADVKEALVPGGSSPVKTALETLRALRDTLRLAVEFKGLTLGSHLDFVASLRGRFARLVAGPPAFRSQQLLALIDAGVVKVPFGPAPEVLETDGGRVLLRSTQLERPFEMVVDRVVRAHLDSPSLPGATSSLLANLARRGRLRPLSFDGVPAGGLDLTEDFHPLSLSGAPEENLWVFGAVSEGARYFTFYIPSPKSRVRAFVDAKKCANVIIGGGSHPVPGEPGPSLIDLSDAGNRVVVTAVPSPTDGAIQMARQMETPRPVLRVALVNNMPDAAFEETERQFRDLLGSSPAVAVDLSCFSLAGVRRGPAVQQVIAAKYRELTDLWGSVPDALVVTGAEPKKAELTDELYWPALESLLWWGRSAVPDMLLSCLTAHAALWAFEGLPRQLLLEKCSGVFTQVMRPGHPLMKDVGELNLPHSRFNEIEPGRLEEAGYSTLAYGPGCGWTVAIGERCGSRLLLLQGHPEYTQLTLLREYRRDVRRYLMGEQGSYPHIPTSYLDREGKNALEEFQRQAMARGRAPALMVDFPFEFARAHVKVSWQSEARRLISNWLESVAGRKNLLLPNGRPVAPMHPSAAVRMGAGTIEPGAGDGEAPPTGPNERVKLS